MDQVSEERAEEWAMARILQRSRTLDMRLVSFSVGLWGKDRQACMFGGHKTGMVSETYHHKERVDG